MTEHATRTAPAPTGRARRPRALALLQAAAVAVACLVMGGLTSPAQALPFLGSLANSPSG